MRIFVFLLALVATSANAGIGDWFKENFGGLFGGDETALVESQALAALSESEMIEGVREALALGVERAINNLGKTGGFSANPLVRIEAPQELAYLEEPLRKLGQDQMVDNFIVTLNRAAENAVPEAAEIFGNAIRGLQLADVKNIVDGGPQAATNFLRGATEEELYKRFRPLVSRATSDTGVTRSYKQLQRVAAPVTMFLKENNIADVDLNLDEHVTQGALDGLFKQLGKEEQKIRENPESRTTEILRRVFI
ncbi:MAG: DUF4197 domain-containing protein [Gammaproteobacteria bacterium]|nr:DUF4197 domain-containing protein [Gammaproteobacteria bacterium]